MTPADGGGAPLKRAGDALDSPSAMRVHELRLRVQRSEYVIDPVLVAEAMLRHALSHRRWWNPVVLCGIPALSMTSCARPAATEPTHVSPAAASAAARSPTATQAHSS